jgi:hypothetical protein
MAASGIALLCWGPRCGPAGPLAPSPPHGHLEDVGGEPGVLNLLDYYQPATDAGDYAPAFRRAIAALPRSSDGTRILGGTLYVPSGWYNVRDTIALVNATGVTLRGAGRNESRIAPRGTAWAQKPVLELRNARNIVIHDLHIYGNAGSPPLSAIQSHAANAACAPDLWSSNLQLSDLTLGDPTVGLLPGESAPRPGLVYGVQFLADPGSDGNNDQATLSNVDIGRFAGAAVAVAGANSLDHRIWGGRFLYGPIGVKLQGGSVHISGTNLGVDAWDFYLDDPVGSLACHPGRPGYYHPIVISGINSESPSNLLWTSAFSNGQDVSDGSAGINVYIQGYNKKGSTPGAAAIRFQSSGKLTLAASWLQLTPAPGGVAASAFVFASDRAHVTLTGNQIFNLSAMDVRGHLVSLGNLYYGGDFAKTRGRFVPVHHGDLAVLRADYSQLLENDDIQAGWR